MCNLSENIIYQSINMERLNAIERMIKADFTKKQIISCGYTEEEFAEAESLLCANAQEIVTTELNSCSLQDIGHVKHCFLI